MDPSKINFLNGLTYHLPFIYFFHQAQRLNYAHYTQAVIQFRDKLYTLDTVLDEVMAKD